MNDNKCPKCGGPTKCLGGASAHPNNWYCENESGCGWRAWENRTPARSAPLSGKWRHGGGYLICGTLRIAKADFDTDPSPELRAELMDWIVATLNDAQNG